MNEKSDKKIVFICTTPRSGSALLSNYMVHNGIFANIDFCGKNNSYEHFQLSTINLKDFLKYSSKDLVDSVIEKTCDKNICGYKMHGHNLANILKIKNPYKSKLSLIKENCNVLDSVNKFIFLKRRDKIAQAVSMYKTMKTNIYHLFQKKDEEIDVKYSFFGIYYFYRTIGIQTHYWEVFFENSKHHYLEVFYEDLTFDRENQIKRIFDYIGIKDFSFVENSDFQKIGNINNENLIVRFNSDLNKKSKIVKNAYYIIAFIFYKTVFVFRSIKELVSF